MRWNERWEQTRDIRWDKMSTGILRWKPWPFARAVSWRALLPACSPRAWWCGKRCARISYTKRKDKKGTDRYNTYPSCPGSPPTKWWLIVNWWLIHDIFLVGGDWNHGILYDFPIILGMSSSRSPPPSKRGRSKSKAPLVFFLGGEWDGNGNGAPRRIRIIPSRAALTFRR